MSSQTDVMARWHDHLRRDLVLRETARAMLDCERQLDRSDVLIVACIALNARLCDDLARLGELAAEW